MSEVTAEFTNDAFLGSGALSYPWYSDVEITENDSDWTLTFTDAMATLTGNRSTYRVTHVDVLRVASAIVEGTVAHVNDACLTNCRYLVSGNLDDVDFDADTADQVMQSAAFGEPIYS